MFEVTCRVFASNEKVEIGNHVWVLLIAKSQSHREPQLEIPAEGTVTKLNYQGQAETIMVAGNPDDFFGGGTLSVKHYVLAPLDQSVGINAFMRAAMRVYASSVDQLAVSERAKAKSDGLEQALEAFSLSITLEQPAAPSPNPGEPTLRGLIRRWLGC